MKEATLIDAEAIGRLLNVDKYAVWEIIKGMKYYTYSDLAMAIHRAFCVCNVDAAPPGPTSRRSSH